jgi:3-methyladenine DNA glycosylase AlkD
MTKAAKLAVEIRAYCEAHADQTQVGKWARYFKEGYDSWGLLDKDNPLWHQQQDEWLARYREMGVSGFLKLGEILFKSPKYEEGALALRFLGQFRAELDRTALDGLEKWFEAGIANWAHTDVLCGEIIGPMVADGRIPWKSLGPWRSSRLKFQRRAVPVSLLKLLKTKPDTGPLLDFLRPLMMDPERVVHQGVGWFLREAWKLQPKPVETFLLEWKDRAPRLIFQYATEKMTAAERARFRKAKG